MKSLAAPLFNNELAPSSERRTPRRHPGRTGRPQLSDQLRPWSRHSLRPSAELSDRSANLLPVFLREEGKPFWWHSRGPPSASSELGSLSRSWPNLFGCFVPRLALLFSVATEWFKDPASNRGAAPEEVHDQRDHCDDQQQVNQAASNVECEKSQQPQYKQNNK